MKLNSPFTKEDFISYQAILDLPKNEPVIEKDKLNMNSPTNLPPRRKGKT